MDKQTYTRRRGVAPLPGGRRDLTTSITIPQEQMLEVVARLRDVSKARVVRDALDAYFASFFASQRGNNRQSAGENRGEDPAA